MIVFRLNYVGVVFFVKIYFHKTKSKKKSYIQYQHTIYKRQEIKNNCY